MAPQNAQNTSLWQLLQNTSEKSVCPNLETRQWKWQELYKQTSALVFFCFSFAFGGNYITRPVLLLFFCFWSPDSATARPCQWGNFITWSRNENPLRLPPRRGISIFIFTAKFDQLVKYFSVPTTALCVVMPQVLTNKPKKGIKQTIQRTQHMQQTNKQNIATGETSQAITPCYLFDCLNSYNFYYWIPSITR